MPTMGECKLLTTVVNQNDGDSVLGRAFRLETLELFLFTLFKATVHINLHKPLSS